MTGNKMDFAGMMAAYTQFFGTAAQPNKPSRSTVQVAALVAPGALVEIDVVAAIFKVICAKSLGCFFGVLTVAIWLSPPALAHAQPCPGPQLSFDYDVPAIAEHDCRLITPAVDGLLRDPDWPVQLDALMS